jgi:DivIVA domain-containing protein
MMRRMSDPARRIPVEADVRALERRARDLPSAGRLGYRREDVDAFVGRAIAALRAAIARNETLRTGSSPAPGGWWGDPREDELDIEGAVFATARFRRGYDMRSVDELLDEIGDAIQRLDAERRALERRGDGAW